MNNTLPFIEPLNALVPLKLAPDKVYQSFYHSASVEEEMHAKSNRFVEDKHRFFNYSKAKFDKKQAEKCKEKK